MTGAYTHIGVIGALSEEVDRLHELLADETITEHVGRRFHSGRLGEQRVTLVQSRIGKVAAAVTASTLIRDFSVDAIVFTGVAGALSDDLRVGDVVVASELIQHDLQGPPELFARGEIPLLSVIELPTDDALTAAAAVATRRSSRRVWTTSSPRRSSRASASIDQPFTSARSPPATNSSTVTSRTSFARVRRTQCASTWKAPRSPRCVSNTAVCRCA